MKRKAKTQTFTQEEVDKLLKEKMDEFIKDRMAWIHIANGETYIGYNVLDATTYEAMNLLEQLLKLMGVGYATHFPFQDDEEYYLVIHGEDKDRADFIQKFIDNNYKLKW